MNAHSSISLAAPPDWDEAYRSANAFRGHAIELFARAETEVSETLLLIAKLPAASDAIHLRHLIGQRFEDLRSALGPNGGMADAGSKAFAALEVFRAYEPLRPVLCHGQGRISIDRAGKWVLQLKVLTFKGQQADRSSYVFDERDSASWLRGLRSALTDLGEALRSLRSKLEGSAA